MSLKNKRILITAGPTWVPLDHVRVISNTATGENGMILAEALRKKGCTVTLVLGPVHRWPLSRSIKVIPFTYFNQLRATVLRELAGRKYDCFIHAAAVSDYQPETSIPKKVDSNKKLWQVSLVPTPKIIDRVRAIDRRLFMIGFKYEPEAHKKTLIAKAAEMIKRSGANIAVANTYSHGGEYVAFLTDGIMEQGPILSKRELAKTLVHLLEQYYGKDCPAAKGKKDR